MDQTILIKDTRGYSCSRCRHRFPATINLSELQCPSCRRVSDNPLRTSNQVSCYNENYRVHPIVEKIKQMLLRNHHHQGGGSCDSVEFRLSSMNNDPWRRRGSSAARKRALLIGVTYPIRKYRLKGTVNDVKNMWKLLVEVFGFHKENILVLTEEETRPEFIPTKKNIERALRWLVEDCKAGDSLVFFFSGHGIRQPDFNNDEVDGFDETICPVDFLQEGMILDNDINSSIVWPLPFGVTLHAIVDACHSGTILDLEYIYNREENKWQSNRPPNRRRKHTNGGLAISISACQDNQYAADTTAFGGKGMNGALTYILVEVVRKCTSPTYKELIEMIHQAIEAVNRSGCLPTRIIRSMLHNQILQKPLLSASEPFDVEKRRFIL